MAIAANNPLLQPGRPLAGNALLQAATALANAQTQPTVDALKSQIGQNNAQTQQALGQVGGLYQGLGQQAQSEIPQIQGVGNSLNSQLGQIGQDEQSQLKGIGDNALASLMKYAPQSDAANSLAQPALGSLASEIARQQGLAAQQQGAFRSFGATQGANYNSLAGSQVGSFAKAGQEALRGIATAGQVKNQPLSAKLASVLGQRGQLISADAAKLRQQEIANSISEAGLGIKQASANASLMNARTNQGKLRVDQQNANTSATKANTAAKQFAYNSNPNYIGSPAWARVQGAQGKAWSSNPNAVGSPAWARVQTANRRGGNASGVKPLSTAENNVWLGKLGTVQALIREGRAAGKGDSQIAASLQNGGPNGKLAKYDGQMISTAFQILDNPNHGVNPATPAFLLAQYGVRLPASVGTYQAPTGNIGAPIPGGPSYNVGF